MSRNPYIGSSSSSPDPVEYEQHGRQQKSHWSLEETPARQARGSFVEKFSPPMTSNRAYEPSIRSNNSEMPGNAPYQPWMQRSVSVAGSETNSLPSYHDSPTQSRQGFTNKKSLRYKLDHGNRARIYLFIALTSCMFLIFVLTALVWIQMDLVKKTVTAKDTESHTVRPDS